MNALNVIYVTVAQFRKKPNFIQGNRVFHVVILWKEVSI